jgi:hypothetical protein
VFKPLRLPVARWKLCPELRGDLRFVSAASESGFGRPSLSPLNSFAEIEAGEENLLK